MKKYYAVRKGFIKGIFKDWEKCQPSVNCFPGSEYVKFFNITDAIAYLMEDESTAYAIPYYANEEDECNYEYLVSICRKANVNYCPKKCTLSI
jgi:viroplasmin and RNaseH domain-containing protein